MENRFLELDAVAPVYSDPVTERPPLLLDAAEARLPLATEESTLAEPILSAPFGAEVLDEPLMSPEYERPEALTLTEGKVSVKPEVLALTGTDTTGEPLLP